MPDIKPNRRNWREFCQEPELTAEEWQEWQEMAAAIRVNNNLLDKVIEATTATTRGVIRKLPSTTRDWSDVVAESDERRRTMRAELAWWREYKRQMSNLEGLPLFDSITFTT